MFKQRKPLISAKLNSDTTKIQQYYIINMLFYIGRIFTYGVVINGKSHIPKLL